MSRKGNRGSNPKGGRRHSTVTVRRDVTLRAKNPTRAQAYRKVESMTDAQRDELRRSPEERGLGESADFFTIRKALKRALRRYDRDHPLIIPSSRIE